MNTRINPYSIPQFPAFHAMRGVATMAPWNQPPSSAYAFPAVDLSQHNLYDIPWMLKALPPVFITGDVKIASDGKHTIWGATIGGMKSNVNSLVVVPPHQGTKGPYGDMQTIRFAVPAGDRPTKILDRPTFKRVLIQIQNRDAANDMNYNFGGASSPLTFGIPAGGNSSFVGGPTPQNELWVSSTNGANIVIGYIDQLRQDEQQQLEQPE